MLSFLSQFYSVPRERGGKGEYLPFLYSHSACSSLINDRVSKNSSAVPRQESGGALMEGGRVPTISIFS